MWVGYVPALKLYVRAVSEELAARRSDILVSPLIWDELIAFPPWFGDNRLHSSHRANLLRRNYRYYAPLGWSEQPSFVYWWPEAARQHGGSPIS
jgi:hypothetical protein